MPVSLPSFPAAVPTPASGEAPAAALSAFAGTASGETPSFDAQMAALSEPAANPVAVASEALSSAPVANSAAVRMRGLAPQPETPAPELVLAAGALCDGQAVQALSAEVAGDQVSEADTEATKSDDSIENDDPSQVRPDPLIACFIATQAPAPLPVERDIACSGTASSDGANASAASATGAQRKSAPNSRAWAAVPGTVAAETDVREQSTPTQVPAATGAQFGTSMAVAGRSAQTSEGNMPVVDACTGGTPPVSRPISTAAAPVADEGLRQVNRGESSGDSKSIATAESSDSTRSTQVIGSSAQPPAEILPEAVATRHATSMVDVKVEENSAEVAVVDSGAARANPRVSSERKSLNVGDKVLESGHGATGIAGAKRYRAMISDITSTAGSTTPSGEQSMTGLLSTGGHGKQTSDVAAQEALAPVSKAFEVVQDAVENLKASKKNVVEVDIADGAGAKLSVRIEYRDGVVHTAFRTDSAELRDQITRDWQTSMSSYGASDGSVRVADPIFSTTPAARDSNLDLGGQFARQQQSQQSPSQTTSSAGGLRHAGSGTSSATTASTATAATPQSVRPETARYLHTLA